MRQTDEVLKIKEDLKQRGLADAVYRALWYDYVLADIEGYMLNEENEEEMTPEEKEIAQIAASRYVYDDDYDKDVSYWGNIENILEDLRGREME